MSTVTHAWDFSVRIGDTTTDVLRASTSHAHDQPVGTCQIDLPLPLPSWVDAGADVVLTATMDGSPLASPLFVGTFRDPDRNHTSDGRTATLLCQGPNYRLTYPFDRDLVYAGGARAAPLALSLGSTYLHLGTQTIAWYGNHAPNGGTSSDKTFTPVVDATFVWVAGRLHGTNSYDDSIGDKTIKDRSRIEIRQGGATLGRAFFPESSENWSGTPDYTNDANWDDFELFVACDPPIAASGGAVTVRFVSGHKPGSSDRDEYEVKNVTYQTAGRTSVRNVVRGLYKRAGFAAGSYAVNEVVGLGGNLVYVGGNGLVDAGQVVMAETDQPIAFANRLLNLFGFWAFDGPDGTPRVRPVRGVPSGTPAEAFTEGVDAFSFRSYTDASRVFNAVLIEGASGTDSAGKQFAYVQETASPLPNPLIPDPPGTNTLRLSDAVLTSAFLCDQAADVQEVNNTDQTFVEWESWPRSVYPSQVVRVTAPTVGFAGLLFLTAVRHDCSAQGLRSSYAGWKGVSTPFVEVDDPDPDEDDAVPTAPRPRHGTTIEWAPYKPLSTVN